MKRLAIRSLALALALAAGGVAAQEYYGGGQYGAQAYGPAETGYGYPQEDYYDQEDAGYYGQQDDGYYGQQDDGYYAQAGGSYGSAGPAFTSRSGAGYSSRGAAYDVARVLSVDPIVERGRPVSRQQCWNEPVQVHASNTRYNRGYPQRQTSGGGALLGAIVGGVLGNTIGDGDGRKVATVAGAVIGGTIGNSIERNNNGYGDGDARYGGSGRSDPRYGYSQGSGYYGQPAAYPQQVQRCQTVNQSVGNERVRGYRVAYEYAGRQYQTVTDYHPGNQIRVRVDVTPAG